MVRTSARFECALRALMVLELHTKQTARDVANKIEMPIAVTLKVLQKLVESGLLKSKVGRTGGFWLSRPRNSINLLDLASAMGELIDLTPSNASSDHAQFGAISALWQEKTQELNESLRRIAISDVIARGNAKPPGNTP